MARKKKDEGRKDYGHICPTYLTNVVNGIYYYYSMNCPSTPVLLTSTSFIWCPKNCPGPTGCIPTTAFSAFRAGNPNHFTTTEIQELGQRKDLDPEWRPLETTGEIELIAEPEIHKITIKTYDTKERFAKLFHLKLTPPDAAHPPLETFFGHEIEPVTVYDDTSERAFVELGYRIVRTGEWPNEKMFHVVMTVP